MMTLKPLAIRKTAAATATMAAALLLAGIVAAQAQAPQRYDNRGRPYYGPSGPNTSYQAGPRTRVYISKRSWLDAGTEVLPGDRKFTDYAYPPGTSFGQQNLNRPLDRQPLNPGSDFGYGDGYNTQGRFPLY